MASHHAGAGLAKIPRVSKASLVWEYSERPVLQNISTTLDNPWKAKFFCSNGTIAYGSVQKRQ